MNLYEINKNIEDVINNGFSFDEETGEILFETQDLEQLEADFNDKLDNVCGYIKNQEALKKSIDDEIKALTERKKQCASKVDSLKEYVTNVMTMRDMKKFESSRNKISFRASKSVNVIDESKIAASYFVEKVERKLDKKTLLADLKEGKEIAGASLLEKKNIQIK